MDKIENEMCPVCHTKNLTLTEDEIDVPHFGLTFVFGMHCSNCGFEKSDIEAEQPKEPCRITFTAEGEDDMKIRVVKSSEATVRVLSPKLGTMEPGPDAIGFVTNVEGLLHRFKKTIEEQRDLAGEDDEVRQAAKSLLKKIWKAECGDIPVKIVIEDPTGNSAIVSDKAVVEKLKGK